MATSLDIAELLDREEEKAKALIRQQKQQKTEAGSNGDVDVDIKMEDTMPRRDPRRLDRPAELELDEAPEPVSPGRHRRDKPNDRKSKDRYLNEREENDERRTRRSRDHTEDDTRAGSDKDSANGSVRSRRRSRSPRSDGRRNNRDHRERSRDRGGDFYRGSGRQSVDRDDSYRPDRREDRRRSRDRGGRDRGGRDDRDRARGGGRDYRGGRDSGHKRKTPEPTDDERDSRTVFVQQLAARLRSREMKDFFEQVGAVVDAQIVKDRVSGRSKGVGYVEFREEASVEKAIQLTGQKLLGIPIIVQLTEAEKNRQAKTDGAPTQSNGVPFHRLYVGNIHFSITEDDIRTVFGPFGELEFVQLQKEEAGRSKGYGFVQFTEAAQAKEALEKMNGFEIAGRPLRVGLGNDKFTESSTKAWLQRFDGKGGQQRQNDAQGSSFSGMGGRGAHAGGTGNFDRPAPRDNDKTGGASALDDTDVGGVNFSNYSRDALMRKLARIDEPEAKTASLNSQGSQSKKPKVVEQIATRCVLLKHMYNQDEETEPGWQKDLEEDVKIECNDKYGKVVHVGLALDNNDGEIYIKFDRIQGGENAYRGLNGRWFGGKQITAQYVVDAVYNLNFPNSDPKPDPKSDKSIKG